MQDLSRAALKKLAYFFPLPLIILQPLTFYVVPLWRMPVLSIAAFISSLKPPNFNHLLVLINAQTLSLQVYFSDDKFPLFRELSEAYLNSSSMTSFFT